jgi:hypothetical protein
MERDDSPHNAGPMQIGVAMTRTWLTRVLVNEARGLTWPRPACQPTDTLSAPRAERWLAVCSRRGSGFRITARSDAVMATQPASPEPLPSRRVGDERSSVVGLGRVYLARELHPVRGRRLRYSRRRATRGYWAQQIADYRLSDGHFVATALYTAGTLLNPIFVQVLPGVLIIAWVALLTLALRHVIPAAGRLGRFSYQGRTSSGVSRLIAGVSRW